MNRVFHPVLKAGSLPLCVSFVWCLKQSRIRVVDASQRPGQNRSRLCRLLAPDNCNTLDRRERLLGVVDGKKGIDVCLPSVAFRLACSRRLRAITRTSLAAIQQLLSRYNYLRFIATLRISSSPNFPVRAGCSSPAGSGILQRNPTPIMGRSTAEWAGSAVWTKQRAIEVRGVRRRNDVGRPF